MRVVRRNTVNELKCRSTIRPKMKFKWIDFRLRLGGTLIWHLPYITIACTVRTKSVYFWLCQLLLSRKLKISRINVIYFSIHCSHSRMRRASIVKITTALQTKRLQNRWCLAINSHNLRLLLRHKHILTMIWHFLVFVFAFFCFCFSFSVYISN